MYPCSKLIHVCVPCVCVPYVCVQYECVLMLVFLTLKRLCALFIIIYLLCNFQHLLETSQSFCPGCLARNIRPHRTTATPHPFGSPPGGSSSSSSYGCCCGSGTAAQSHLDLVTRWPLWPPTWTNFIWQPILVQNKLPLMCERPKQLAVASWNFETGRPLLPLLLLLEVCGAFAVRFILHCSHFCAVCCCEISESLRFSIAPGPGLGPGQPLLHVAVVFFGLYSVDSRNYVM